MKRRRAKRLHKREAIERERLLVDRLCAELKLTPPRTVDRARDVFKIIIRGAKR